MKMLLVVLAAVGILLFGTALRLYTPDKTRKDLASYLRAPTDLLDVAGMRLHVRDDGPRAAPVIILLHGLGASLHTWEPWSAALAPEFRVIRLDIPGFGLTGPDPTGDYSDARSLQLIVGLMDALGIARASLVGNSLGGRIAWKFAAAYPQRTDRLVLISPDGFSSPGFAYGKAPEVPMAVRLLPYALPAALVRMSMAPAYGDPAFVTDALVTRYRDMMLAPGVRRAIIARMEQAILTEPEPLLRSIAAPTLLLWGEKDAMIPFTNAADYMRALPHATLVSLPTLGHLPHEEAPAHSLEPVRAFLKR